MRHLRDIQAKRKLSDDEVYLLAYIEAQRDTIDSLMSTLRSLVRALQQLEYWGGSGPAVTGGRGQ